LHGPCRSIAAGASPKGRGAFGPAERSYSLPQVPAALSPQGLRLRVARLTGLKACASHIASARSKIAPGESCHLFLYEPLVLSDLHLEFAPIELAESKVDAVILAGDIDVGDKGLRWAMHRSAPTPVFYVLGNHEFYNHDLFKLRARLRRLAEGTNVRLLENDSAIWDGVRFLGCTLWSDWTLFGQPDLHAKYAEQHMSDFSLIRVSEGEDSRLLVADDAATMHRTSENWLRQELASGGRQPTVVITHFAPARESIAPRFAQDALTPGFVVDLESLVRSSGALLWVHGHVHDSFDYKIGSTRVLCNPRGYPDENAGRFDPRTVVAV